MAHGANRAAAAAYHTSLALQAAQEAAWKKEKEEARKEQESLRLRHVAETEPMREYEAARLARGKATLAGKYDVSSDPTFQAARAGVLRSQGQALAGEEEGISKSGLPGFSASYLSDKLKETGASTILNMASAFTGRQQELVNEGSEAGGKLTDIYQNMYSQDVGAENLLTQGTASQRGAYTQGMYGLTGTKLGIASNEAIQKKAQQQSGFNTAMSSAGNMCCFIFYTGNKLTDYVHKYRDEFYHKGGFVDLGYRLMALWLVPIIGKNIFIKKLFIVIMLDPLAKYAEAYYQNKVLKKLFYTPFKLFWPNVWKWYGRTALTYNRIAYKLGF